MHVPRLTGTLRAFSGVSIKPPNSDQVNTFKFLEEKRKEVISSQASEHGLSWKELKDALLKKREPSSNAIVIGLFKNLKTIIRTLAGTEMPSDTVDDSTVLVFRMFHDQSLVEQKDMIKLKQLFGPVQLSQATAACDVVRQIVDLVSADTVDLVLSGVPTNGAEYNDDFGSTPSGRMYGQNVKFTSPFDSQASHQITQDFADLDFDVDRSNSPLNGFSMKYEPPPEPEPGPSRRKQEQHERRDFTWMNKLVLSYFGESIASLGEEALEELCSTVYHLLCSEKTSDELQYQLIELLGFSRVELVEKLLHHRQEISRISPPVMNAQVLRQEFRASNKTNPGLGLGICVQSEQEKNIRKWVRKEEKKLQKFKDVEGEQEMEFDPEMLRAQRESALTAAAAAPLFSKRERATPSRPVYPNVYDSSLDAKNTAGFIAGAKLMLPLGFDRKTTNMYEEVEIPPPEKAPIGVPKQLIEISSLDEIGQIAFEGTKTLNRMQSIVYTTAYHSNENLLICAPTGAGKTNIALLCIVREIKQNIVEGKIQLDKFKIVYVAPMKALAAEMVANFSKRLQPLGVKVRELTGDMQLTKSEIKETQILVTTPEKWDVVTRKATGDVALAQLVKLLIIDEVHLLHGDRGPVLESLVARTLRQVEVSQNMIRILGLSATLPGYEGVARFLNVNPFIGLFYFDSRFRPVPLGMSFVGIKSHGNLQQMQDMDTICYDRVQKMVKQGHQVMVFVHARNGTVRTATVLRDKANAEGDSLLFSPESSSNFGSANKQVQLSRNKQLRDLFPCGFAFHHAGMLRQDRNLVERMFSQGFVKVLVCTATLAWGVNLPAHAVIIRGTELYDATKGTFVDLGILDVMQIFGRAGRPQFDTSGHGTILTTYDKLSHYLSLLTCQYPIESQFIEHLADNLNAEVALGTVTNVDEAVHWLSYTYLHIRMHQNPHIYGLKYDAAKDDPDFTEKRTELIVNCARQLDKLQMIRFDERTSYLHATDLGRTASHFYIKHATVEVFNEKLKPIMNDAEILAMVSMAEEFNQLKIRDDEMEELDFHTHDSCVLPVAGGSENTHGKVNILIQTYISRGKISSFSLISDQAYVSQNATRILRALFEIVLRKGWPLMAGRLLVISKVLEKQLWAYEHPLRQMRQLRPEVLDKIEGRNLKMEVLKEMPADEIGHLVRHVAMGKTIKRSVEEFVSLQLEASIQPITRTVLRVHLTITPDFLWSDAVHGRTAESFWIWVEDPDTNIMYHSEYCLLSKKQVLKKEAQTLVFTIPIVEPLPSQYLVHAESDRWLGSTNVCAISFQHLILPERHPPQTDLLDLRPLPVTSLCDIEFEKLYNFTHFNPIQTQIFHTLYHTDCNVLLGAPTGSGKTIVAEIAMFRVFREYPGTKVVYIAPLKALVRERIDDWKVRLEQNLKKKIVELTGDVTPDVRAIESADVIVTTPEKWDGISRSWQTRSYVKSVSLIVIDEIHLLGEDRGPVLEVIVSRTNFISSHTGQTMRVIGLSTALANARDLADWLGIKKVGLYNFRPSVRPVPMEVHIQGFPGKHYCPRMATMNKPCYQAIKMHSPTKPVLIFVSSRRQTRLTALDLIAFLVLEPNPKQWLHMPEEEIDAIISGIKDVNLKLTLAFGIAIHHAGLQEKDRKTVEKLFVGGNIQILIATATLAWGVNFPAHLVVVKGTEYYDGKTRRYVDFPITDVLQMIGRAGRPQFDDHGVAVVLVQDSKKHFYKKFLYEPFPVESSLLQVLPEHINAEVVAGTIGSKQQAMDYLTYTYFFRRLLQNPSFYQLEDIQIQGINTFLSGIIEKVLLVLEQANCIDVGEDNRVLLPTTVGRIASYYYLSHKTVFMFRQKLTVGSTLEEILQAMCDATEYEELPVRHNEDALNAVLANNCPIAVSQFTLDSPHTKAHLLFQAHFSRLQLPCTDYLTDLKSVLDQSVRILQAMIDIFADQGWLCGTIQCIILIQMVIQGRWNTDNPLLMLPHVESHIVDLFKSVTGGKRGTSATPTLPSVMAVCGDNYECFARAIRDELDEWQIEEAFKVLQRLPIISVKLSVGGWWEDGGAQREFKPVNLGYIEGKRPDSHWITVHADQEYCVNIDLRRSKPVKRGDSRAHAPKFSKIKDEGWMLVLGDVEKRELLALKRVGFVSGHNSTQVVFYTPEKLGRVIYTIYLISDSYLGLDQQYDICLDVIPASLRAQVNAELTDADFEES